MCRHPIRQAAHEKTRLCREDGSHALAIADSVLLMTSPDRMICGRTSEVLTEENLLSLYGVPLKRAAFEFEGRKLEVVAPVLL